jgi:hypothetical protein
MKTVKIIIVFALFFPFICYSQNLDNLPKEKRDSILIAKAKEIVLIWGPAYYREYKSPIIKREVTNLNYPGGGRIFYIVTFLYDKTKETLDEDFAAEVRIWADTGIVGGITFGNGAMILPGRNTRCKNSIEKVPYQVKEKRDTIDSKYKMHYK